MWCTTHPTIEKNMKLSPLIVVVGGLLVTGYAVAQQPVFQDKDYTFAAGMLVATKKCGQLGLMDLETAYLGEKYAQNAIASHVVDQDQMDRYIRKYQDSSDPTAAVCDTVAMHVLSKKRQIDQNNAEVDASNKAWSGALGGRNYITNPITLPPSTQTVQPNFGYPPHRYTPAAVYPDRACVGTVVQGVCMGSIQSTEPVRRCMGAMVNGECTGPVIISK